MYRMVMILVLGCGPHTVPSTATPSEPAAAASTPAEAAPRPESISPPSPRVASGDPAWAGLELQTIGEADLGTVASDFFVSTADARILRIGHEQSGWWSPERFTPIEGLHSDGAAAVSGDLSVAAVVSYLERRVAVEIWDLARGLRVETVRYGEEALHLTASEHHVAVLEDYRGQVTIFDERGQRVRVFSVSREPISIALSADAQTFVTWTLDRTPTLHVYRASGRNNSFPALQHPEGSDAFALYVNTDGSQLAMGVYGAVRVVNARNGRPILDRSSDEAYIDAVALGPSGELFASHFVNGSTSGLIRGRAVTELVEISHSLDASRVVWRGSRLLVSGRNTLAAWENGQPVFGLERSLPYGGFAWRPLRAPEIEVFAYNYRAIYDARTGRLISGETYSEATRRRHLLHAVGVAATNAQFETVRAQGAFLLDVSRDGQRRLVIPEGHWPILVGPDTLTEIARVVGIGTFASTSDWFASTSSYRQNRQRDLIVRNAADGAELARAELPRGEIERLRLLANDVIVIHNQHSIRSYRFDEGSLVEMGHFDVDGISNWAIKNTELLVAIPGEQNCRVVRLSLPELEPMGQTRFEGIRDPSLAYLPDNRRFGIILNRQLQFRTLPTQ